MAKTGRIYCLLLFIDYLFLELAVSQSVIVSGTMGVPLGERGRRGGARPAQDGGDDRVAGERLLRQGRLRAQGRGQGLLRRQADRFRPLHLSFNVRSNFYANKI